MNKKDHSDFKKGPVARLISVVVLYAIIAVVLSHTWTVKAPAITRTAAYSENIFVVNGSPELQLELGALSHRCDLFFAEGEGPLHIKAEFLLREETYGIGGARWDRIAESGPELGASREDGDIWFVHKQIRSWCRPIIFSHSPKDLICLAEIFDSEWPDAYVGAQLAFSRIFLGNKSIFESLVTIVQDQILNAQAYSGEKHKEQGGVGNPLWSCISSGLLFAIGLYFLYQVVFKSENCLACGIAFMLGAWPVLFVSVWLFVVGVLGWHLWPLDSG